MDDSLEFTGFIFREIYLWTFDFPPNMHFVFYGFVLVEVYAKFFTEVTRIGKNTNALFRDV